MLTIADFKLGRMSFPTIEDALKEAVGDALEATGLGLAAGEGKARSFPLVIPVRASSSELNPYADGDRMRRQVRSMMENAKLRLGGLYMRCLFDTELNAWLLIGAGDLEYDDGGVTFANYKLSLNDSYMVGRPRTHRAARRIEAIDRRLSTTPRDIERLVYSSAFAATPAVAQTALPSGVVDLRSRGGVSTSVLPPLATADAGSVVPLKGVVQGDVISFEQPESAMNLGDVLVLDRRGFKAPAGMMEAKEPQETYGWEEVYGTDYPLSSEDIPVLSNGLCRIRHMTTPGFSFALDQFSGGGWVERGRIVPMANTTATSAFTFPAQPATVKEWTPERAVVMCRFNCGGTGTVDVYIILQRGWSAPRIEVYTRPGSEVRANVTYVPNDASGMLLSMPSALRVSAEGWASTVAIAESDEPWFVLAPVSGGGVRHNFAAGAPGNVVTTENTFYYGATRYALRYEGSKASATTTGWAGLELSLGGTESVTIFEAETYRNTGSATSSEVTETDASGEKAVQDTQVAETANTLLEPVGGTAIGLKSLSAYALWGRVKVIPSYKAAVLGTAGIVSLWALNDSSGNAVDSADSNPGTPNGTLTRGQASLLPDGEGAATKFNGTTGYFKIAASANLKVGDVFTLEAWIKPESIGTDQCIISGNNNTPQLRLNAAGKLELIKTQVASVVQSTTTLVANTVYHVVVTKTGATVKIYVNGVDVTGAVTNQTMSSLEVEWNIGRESSAFNANYFKGIIQYAAVYNVALSKAVMEEHYAARTTPTVASLRAKIGTAEGATKTTSSESYVWVQLGSITKPLATSRFALNAWRSAGTAGWSRIDRLMAVPLSTSEFNGLSDFGGSSLYDVRAIPELVAR